VVAFSSNVDTHYGQAGRLQVHLYLFFFASYQAQLGAMSLSTKLLSVMVFLTTAAVAAPTLAEESTLKEGAREVGRAVGTAAREVGDGAKKVGKAVGAAAKEGVEAVKEGAKEAKRAMQAEK
jgi:hypothetical protein